MSEIASPTPFEPIPTELTPEAELSLEMGTVSLQDAAANFQLLADTQPEVAEHVRRGSNRVLQHILPQLEEIPDNPDHFAVSKTEIQGIIAAAAISAGGQIVADTQRND